MNDPRFWLKSLPNQLTLARIAVVPILILLYPIDFFVVNVFCAILFALASITDFLDGYLARKYQSVTSLGALLDPLADKVLIAAALILLAHARVLPAFVAVLMICRDIAVSGLRLMALEQNLSNIAVNEFGKWKTALQQLAVTCLLINRDVFDWPIRAIGMISLWIALGLSLYSAYIYGQGYWEASKIHFEKIKNPVT